MRCNVSFCKSWTDNELAENPWNEYGIEVLTENGYMHQVLDAMAYDFRDFGQKMIDKSYLLDVVVEVEFATIGSCAPIRFTFLPANPRGIIPIEIDLQVYDNPDENARCRMRIEAEPGMLERFGKAVQRVAIGEVGGACSLNPDLPANCAPMEDGL